MTLTKGIKVFRNTLNTTLPPPFSTYSHVFIKMQSIQAIASHWRANQPFNAMIKQGGRKAMTGCHETIRQTALSLLSCRHYNGSGVTVCIMDGAVILISGWWGLWGLTCHGGGLSYQVMGAISWRVIVLLLCKNLWYSYCVRGCLQTISQ